MNLNLNKEPLNNGGKKPSIFKKGKNFVTTYKKSLIAGTVAFLIGICIGGSGNATTISNLESQLSSTGSQYKSMENTNHALTTRNENLEKLLNDNKVYVTATEEQKNRFKDELNKDEEQRKHDEEVKKQEEEQKKKAEEERVAQEKAKQEADKKAQEEQQKQQQAAAQQAQQQQSQSSQQQSTQQNTSNSDRTVYVVQNGTTKVYHYSKSCSALSRSKNPIAEMTEKEALSRNLRHCEKE